MLNILYSPQQKAFVLCLEENSTNSNECAGEIDAFDNSKNELKSLLDKYRVDVDELDFNDVSQHLFDGDLTVLKQIEENMPNAKVNFTRFESEFKEKFKGIWNVKNPSQSNNTENTFPEFKSEITKPFQLFIFNIFIFIKLEIFVMKQSKNFLYTQKILLKYKIDVNKLLS